MGKTHHEEVSLEELVRSSTLICLGSIVSPKEDEVEYLYSKSGFRKRSDVSEQSETEKKEVCVVVRSAMFKIEEILSGEEESEEIEIIMTPNFEGALSCDIMFHESGIRKSPIFDSYKREYLHNSEILKDKIIMFLRRREISYGKGATNQKIYNRNGFVLTYAAGYEKASERETVMKLIKS